MLLFMRGVYTAHIDIAGIDEDISLMTIRASSSTVVEIISVSVSNLDSEVSEQLSIAFTRIGTYGTPTGTTVTPEKHEGGDQAAAATVLGELTAEPTAYAAVPLDKQGVNALSGYRYDPMPEERPTIAPSAAIGVRLLTTPSTPFDCSVAVVFREIG